VETARFNMYVSSSTYCGLSIKKIKTCRREISASNFIISMLFAMSTLSLKYDLMIAETEKQ